MSNEVMDQEMNYDATQNNGNAPGSVEGSIKTEQEETYVDTNGDANETTEDASGDANGPPDKVYVTVQQNDVSNAMVAVAENDDLDVSAHASFEIKPDGKSYKYPQLKRFYEFGPWVGRNRKAICRWCKHQSASSQPERLIKHMKRCPKLSDEDKALADGLLLESNSNKKRSQTRSSLGTDSEYFGDDDQNSSDRKIPLISAKRIKKMDTNDRKTHIDQSLTRFIMCCRIPLKAIHSKEFVEFVRSLDPDYRLPSRETITNNLIPDLLNIL